MKVDSNTKGNTYWFYFSVQDFRIGVRYTFNIYNFTRSMEKFYKEGMNVLTKAEKQGGQDADSEPKDPCPAKPKEGPEPSSTDNSPREQATTPIGQWRYGTCQNILFEQSELYMARPPVICDR
jgi:hypothetical protein